MTVMGSNDRTYFTTSCVANVSPCMNDSVQAVWNLPVLAGWADGISQLVVGDWPVDDGQRWLLEAILWWGASWSPVGGRNGGRRRLGFDGRHGWYLKVGFRWTTWMVVRLGLDAYCCYAVFPLLVPFYSLSLICFFFELLSRFSPPLFWFLF